MRRRAPSSKQFGFTLLELTVSLAVAVILTSVAVPVVSRVMLSYRMRSAVAAASLGKDSSDNATYTTTTHQPDGTVASVTSTTQPDPAPDTLQFRRRWVIEKDSPVTGVRRVTVAVLLTSPAVGNVNFQMSMVRP